jgi:DNA primase
MCNAAKVKAAVSPLDFYRVELPGMPPPKSESGWVDGGLCPFHDDKHKGNFRVNLDTGAFTCFACGAKGSDIISFAQLRHALSFRDALKAVAESWGVH